MLAVVFVFLFISHNVNARSTELIEASLQNDTDSENNIRNMQEKTAIHFPNGIVRYLIDFDSYDKIITDRIRAAMDTIEASSCVVFDHMKSRPDIANGSWIHFTNPNKERECFHQPVQGDNGEIAIAIGYDCMKSRSLLHSILHALGFKDEVSHPHRDQYIRIMWDNIQPVYRPLFRIQLDDAPYMLVEYDPMSVMHFHDRAFSTNGGPTIVPRMAGLLIAPSDTLSQLDVMKLRLRFGRECNKRKVGDLVENCKNILYKSRTELLKGYDSDSSQSSSSDYTSDSS